MEKTNMQKVYETIQAAPGMVQREVSEAVGFDARQEISKMKADGRLEVVGKVPRLNKNGRRHMAESLKVRRPFDKAAPIVLEKTDGIIPIQILAQRRFGRIGSAEILYGKLNKLLSESAKRTSL